MKILWVCNLTLPNISEKLNLKVNPYGGWIISSLEEMKKNKRIELGIVSIENIKSIYSYKEDNVTYWVIPKKQIIEAYKQIVENFNPDLINIYGTEYAYKLNMVRAVPDRKYIITVQGLISYCANHIQAGLPIEAFKIKTIRSILMRDNIIGIEKNFIERGKKEEEIIREIPYIIGRTTWDNICIHEINSKAIYFKCDETMRKSFYENEWSYEECNKHTIFVSQATYSLKGVHLLFKALPNIIKEYPRTHVYIGGNDITDIKSLKDKIKLSSYGKYLKKIIKKLDIENNVTFLGNLSEEQMCKELKKANVFVSCSSIENSSNSLAEAMLIGTPCIASNVGGINDMLTHGQTGFIYPFNEYYIMGYYIKKIFEDNILANELSLKAKQISRERHDREKNAKKLIQIYQEVIKR